MYLNDYFLTKSGTNSIFMILFNTFYFHCSPGILVGTAENKADTDTTLREHTSNR